MHAKATLPTSILCAVDFSPGSETALAQAIRLAARGESHSGRNGPSRPISSLRIPQRIPDSPADSRLDLDHDGLVSNRKHFHHGQLGEAFSADVIVMHVVPTLDHIVEYGLLASSAADITTGMLSAAEEKLRDMVERVAGSEERDLELIACFGEAATTICAEAKSRAIDLIVLATRGLTGVRHVLLGSTAERVVRSATCPVWTTHAAPAGSA